jgi:hypothetical protein
MADIGSTAKLVNARDLRLEVGSDEYVKVQNLFLHIERVEDRRPTTDGNILYLAGRGNHYFTCDLLFTVDEGTSLNTLTETDANGDWTSTAWKIVGTGRDSSTITYEATGVLEQLDVEAGDKGGTMMKIFVRVTGDTITES